jgi:ATP-dependent RNA helicase DeaD
MPDTCPGFAWPRFTAGPSIADQIRQLRAGAQIIVATPGRLIDLMQRRAADLSAVATCVLDEADEMLNMGFQEEIDRILERMPAERQTWLFSATMPSGVAAIARNYLNDPCKVSVGGRQRMAPNITTFLFPDERAPPLPGAEAHHRCDARDLRPGVLPNPQGYPGVAEALIQEGCRADALHGDLSQAQRDHVMRKFRRQSIRLLVATDVAARGLDVDAISHIIHYNLPDDPETYTHRSGRTARAGRSGVSPWPWPPPAKSAACATSNAPMPCVLNLPNSPMAGRSVNVSSTFRESHR